MWPSLSTFYRAILKCDPPNLSPSSKLASTNDKRLRASWNITSATRIPSTFDRYVMYVISRWIAHQGTSK